jgi:hypothetical protein
MFKDGSKGERGVRKITNAIREPLTSSRIDITAEITGGENELQRITEMLLG